MASAATVSNRPSTKHVRLVEPNRVLVRQERKGGVVFVKARSQMTGRSHGQHRIPSCAQTAAMSRCALRYVMRPAG